MKRTERIRREEGGGGGVFQYLFFFCWYFLSFRSLEGSGRKRKVERKISTKVHSLCSPWCRQSNLFTRTLTKRGKNLKTDATIDQSLTGFLNNLKNG